MKKRFQQACKMVEAIEKQYDLLSIENENFFNAYHDTMQIQKDCANEELSEMEHHMEKGNSVAFEVCFENIQRTRDYCKAVIKLQAQTEKLSEPIYG